MKKRSAHGFALIDLVFVCGVVGVLCSIAVPRLLLAKDVAGAASAIGSMRSINSAQISYALTCGAGYYAPNLSTLGRAPVGSKEPFITGGLGDANTVVKSGYVVQLTATPDPASPPSCNGLSAGLGGIGFKAAADPASMANVRYFGTNSNAFIYEANTTMFPLMPEIGAPGSGQPLH